MAKKKQKDAPCKIGIPLWMGTFGDLMSLLLTFFILLLSMAVFVKERIDAAVGSLEGALGILEKGESTEIRPKKKIQATDLPIQRSDPNGINAFANMVSEFSEITKNISGPSMTLEEGEKGFVLRIPNDILFDSGSAKLKDMDSYLLLRQIALKTKKLGEEYTINIIGNTDNVPISNARYKDNWELSIARGVSVVKELIKGGVSPKKLSAGGRGEYNLISYNDTQEGRALNRRVDIQFIKKDLRPNKKQESALKK